MLFALGYWQVCASVHFALLEEWLSLLFLLGVSSGVICVIAAVPFAAFPITQHTPHHSLLTLTLDSWVLYWCTCIFIFLLGEQVKRPLQFVGLNAPKLRLRPATRVQLGSLRTWVAVRCVCVRVRVGPIIVWPVGCSFTFIPNPFLFFIFYFTALRHLILNSFFC